MIEPALRLADNAVRHRARLVRAYGTTPYVEVEEGQLIQVFTNLLSNAVDAIPEGHAADNEIRVTTYTDDDGRQLVFLTGGAFSPHASAFLESVPNLAFTKHFNPPAELRQIVEELLK